MGYIKLKEKTCKCGCGVKGYWYKKGMLKACFLKSYEGKEAVKKANAFTRNIKKKTGELELFLSMWAKMRAAREMDKTEEELEQMDPVSYFLYISQFKVCAITLEPVNYFIVMCFSHVLNKNSFKRFRLVPENILLVQPHIHTIYEFESRGKLNKWVGGRKLEEYRDYLKSKYSQI